MEVDVPLCFVHTFEVNLEGKNELITVNVFYNWKSSRCEKYKVFGHSCQDKNQGKGDAPPASMATDEIDLTTSKIHPPEPILATSPLKKNGDDTRIIPLVVEDL